jgi:hypothetical protein
MVRGGSFSAKTIANTIKTSCGITSKIPNHSAAENEGGQRSSQNGTEPIDKIATHTNESMVNNRAFGFATDRRRIQPPP